MFSGEKTFGLCFLTATANMRLWRHDKPRCNYDSESSEAFSGEKKNTEDTKDTEDAETKSVLQNKTEAGSKNKRKLGLYNFGHVSRVRLFIDFLPSNPNVSQLVEKSQIN